MEILLDPRTIGIVVVAVNLAMSAMLWVASLPAVSMRGAGHWAVAQFAIAIGLGLNISRPFLADWLAIVVANTLLFFGMGVMLCGIKLYKEQAAPWSLVIGGSVLTATLAVIFTYVDPSQPFRTAYIAMVYAVFSGWCARELLVPVTQPLRTAYWLTGGAFAIYGVSSLARAIGTAFYFPADLPFAPNIVNIVNILIGLLASICASFGYVLMINYRMAMALERLASVDALTGALNRRSFRSSIKRLSLNRSRVPLGIVMFDIDHFKTINDHFGHPVGDIVLQRLADSARTILRDSDLFIRMGGEEFCAVLDDATEDQALAVAQRIRAACSLSAPTVAGIRIDYTLSAGVNSGARTQPITDLIAHADRALYDAKKRGRNQVVRASTLEAELSGNGSSDQGKTWLHKTFIDLEETP